MSIPESYLIALIKITKIIEYASITRQQVQLNTFNEHASSNDKMSFFYCWSKPFLWLLNVVMIFITIMDECHEEPCLRMKFEHFQSVMLIMRKIVVICYLPFNLCEKFNPTKNLISKPELFWIVEGIPVLNYHYLTNKFLSEK